MSGLETDHPLAGGAAPTLILTPRHTGDSQFLWRAAVRRGWHVERLRTWRIPDHLREAAEPVLYVEALFGPTLADELGLRLLEPPDDWLVRLPPEYRLREIRLATMAEARAQTAPAFVKPPVDKSFAARVYAGAELPDGLPDDMPVLVSEVVAWESEFRCFILDRELRTFSLYARHGELQDDEDYASTDDEAAAVTDFVSRLLADPRVELPRAIGVDVGVDVGVIAGRGWAVVEANGVWGAGIYACDPAEALEVIRHATIREGKWSPLPGACRSRDAPPAESAGTAVMAAGAMSPLPRPGLAAARAGFSRPCRHS